MRIHMYVVQHDKGFAPNPFWGVCTLACCKPRRRKSAEVGDVVMGFGSASQEINLGGRVIYWMKVERILTFDEYWHDPQFAKKKPEMRASLAACYGDNIYHHDRNGEWQQAKSFHTDGHGLGSGNLERDTSFTDRVLLSRDFAYWGGAAKQFPHSLKHLVPTGQTERCHLDAPDKAKVLTWIQSIPDRGYRSPPADWIRDHAQAIGTKQPAAARATVG